MGYTARFERRAQYIDVDGGDYELYRDFMPPATGMSYQLGGTGRNISGLVRTGRAYSERAMTFSIKCNGTTATETHILAGRLQAFLLASSIEKTYLAYRLCPFAKAQFERHPEWWDVLSR